MTDNISKLSTLFSQNKKIVYLKNPDVLRWVFGDLSFLKEGTQQCENDWGRKITNAKQNWSGPFAEIIVKELLDFKEIPHNQDSYDLEGKILRPDISTANTIYEVKTGTYKTEGTAHEKIPGAMLKYASLHIKTGKSVKIICVARAEVWAKENGYIHGGLKVKISVPVQDFVSTLKTKHQTEIIGLTDKLLELLNSNEVITIDDDDDVIFQEGTLNLLPTRGEAEAEPTD